MAKNNKLINSLKEVAKRNRQNNIDHATNKLVPHVYASIALALHRQCGWGFKRINRLFYESQCIWEELGADNMIDLCERETGILLKGVEEDNYD